MPSQKFGSATPNWASPITVASAARPRFAAASTPTGMAMPVDRQIDISAKGRLTTARSAMSSATGTE